MRLDSRAALVAVVLTAACASSPGRNPTPEQLDNEEQTACAGVPDKERDADPFANAELIEGVAELREMPIGKVVSTRLDGAEITLRATKGVTAPWLTRVLRCHAARHATTMLPDRAYDPLAVGRPRIAVAETDAGFVVAIRSAGNRDAREILRRAQRLAVSSK